MRITFQLRFHTVPGQSLWLVGAHPALGNDKVESAIPLEYLDFQFWRATVNLPPDAVPKVPAAYRYLLRQKDGSIVEDWGNDRLLEPEDLKTEQLLIVDSWNDPGQVANVFYTEPFQTVLLGKRDAASSSAGPARKNHRFEVKAPFLAATEKLCIIGNATSLGDWSTNNPLLLDPGDSAGGHHISLDLDVAAYPLHYKYGVYDTARKLFVRYEDGENRVLTVPPAPGQSVVVRDGFANLPLTSWKGAGVAIPVFSLRSEQSFGIGEFSDLKLLVDWCQRTGLKLIQVLPVNDTTATNSWRDSYPYSAISASALHPLYVALRSVAENRHQRIVSALEPERLRLNALGAVDYEAVLKAKLPALRALYAAQKRATFRTAAYRDFFARNKHWLVPYAAFCRLRDQYGTADFNQWPAHRRYDPVEVGALAAHDMESADAIGFHYFVQFHLHQQLRDAAEYAHAHGVILKGDIAIGVYRHGVDAWQDPEQYHLEMQAGAPPDPFSDKGQNWSFPTYDWDRMHANGYAWWKQRFEQMGRYFDAFRIDHILGFFRIWSIPLEAVEGILGHFVPALPIHALEFAARGIEFDHDRYVRPYITGAVLEEIFGGRHEEVKHRFLETRGPDRFELKPEFATQRQVENFIAAQSEPSLGQLKLGLFDLASNVILLEEPGSGGRQFHFRFGIESTSSFRNLDAPTRARLKDLYIDYFFRRQEAFWREQGLQKLPALKRATNMLVCGEDLGMVPACVPEVMKQLGLLSLEVQRMPKRLNQQFSSPKDAPYLSVVTPSTHDMSTLRGWWKEDAAVTQQFYNQELGEPGIAPPECGPGINQAIIRQHLASPAMWSIFQIQDLLGMEESLRRSNPDEERINVPANPKHYWQYRLHLSLEQLLSSESFNHHLHSLISASHRA